MYGYLNRGWRRIFWRGGDNLNARQMVASKVQRIARLEGNLQSRIIQWLFYWGFIQLDCKDVPPYKGTFVFCYTSPRVFCLGTINWSGDLNPWGPSERSEAGLSGLWQSRWTFTGKYIWYSHVMSTSELFTFKVITFKVRDTRDLLRKGWRIELQKRLIRCVRLFFILGITMLFQSNAVLCYILLLLCYGRINSKMSLTIIGKHIKVTLMLLSCVDSVSFLLEILS